MILRALCLLTLAALPLNAPAVTFSGIRAFGDSLSDRGNTVAELYQLLNGTDTYNSNFYDDGRWSNGPLWIEHVAQALGVTTWSRNDGSALSHGQDFAWGGSESGTGYTDGVLPNLLTQIQFYSDNPFVGPLFDFSIDTKLFSVWSGGNDVINAVQSGTPVDIDALTTGMAANIGTAVTELYNLGGRHFLVPNLPDLGKKPNYRTNPFYAGQATAIVDAYNPKLAATLANLRATLPGITIYAFDARTLLDDVIANPGNYNLTNVTENAYVADTNLPLGGSVRQPVDEYLFWDTTHPTRIGHAILARSALELIAATAQPPAVTPGTTADVTAPHLLVSGTPRSTRRDTLVLRGLAMDDTALDHVEIATAGRNFRPVSRQSRWRARVDLEPGRNVVRIRAVDTAGNRSPTRRVVIIRQPAAR